MKKSASTVAAALCVAIALIATGIADPAHPMKESALLQSSLRYERVLTTPADFPPSQRTLLALTLAAAESQPIDPSEFLSVYQQAGTLLSYHKISDTSYTWDGAQWVNDHRTTYTYGAGSRLTDETSQTWSGTQWDNSTKQMYTYDGNGRLSTMTWQHWQSSAWVNVAMLTYSYDGGGNMIGMVAQTWQTSVWVNSSNTIMTYSGGRLATSTTQTWQASAWVNSSLITYTYDGGGHITQMLMQNWQGGVWVNQSLYTFTYDVDWRETQSLTQIWSGGVWGNATKSDYSYDGSGNEILAVQSMWDSVIWMATDADTSKYSGGYLVESVDLNVLFNTLTSTQYTHDGLGNLIADLQQGSPVGGSWTNESRNAYVYESYVDVAVGGEDVPLTFELAQNYPNPFNPSTVISYSLARDCHVQVVISNILGQMVTTVVDADQTVGLHSAVWNGLDDRGMHVPSGIYLFRVQAGDFAQVRKMVLLK